MTPTANRIRFDVKRNLAAAKGLSFDDYLRKTDSLRAFNLYRGGSPLSDLCFMTDYIGHAREYGDPVDGIVCDPEDVLRFDTAAFERLRHALGGLGRAALKKMYAPFAVKLPDVQEATAFAYRFLRSEVPYEDVSWDARKNDMLVPLMVHYARTEGKNVVVFTGGDYADYGGQDEYVVDDISRYPKLSDLWKQANRKTSVRESADDAAYLDAVRRGDTETCQRMVDAAAKAAGFTEKAYHGTARKFDVFKGYAFFFTRDRTTAEAFADLRGGDRVIEAFIKLGDSYKEDFKGGSWSDMEDRLETLFSKYDSAEFYNVWDRTGDTNQIVVWDSARVKSAEPVTYDDAGNVIPLSKRFNSASDDIRESEAPSITVKRDDSMFTAYAGRRIVGRLIVDRYAKPLAVFKVAVDEPFRRKGVGTALYRAAEEAYGPLTPSGTYSDDAFKFWSSYRPDAVKYDLRRYKDLLMGRKVEDRGMSGTIVDVGEKGVTAQIDGKAEGEVNSQFWTRNVDHLLPKGSPKFSTMRWDTVDGKRVLRLESKRSAREIIESVTGTPAKPLGTKLAGAAIKTKDGKIHVGAVHMLIPQQDEPDAQFGFVTDTGVFLTREEAARFVGGTSKELHTDDLSASDIVDWKYALRMKEAQVTESREPAAMPTTVAKLYDGAEEHDGQPFTPEALRAACAQDNVGVVFNDGETEAIVDGMWWFDVDAQYPRTEDVGSWVHGVDEFDTSWGVVMPDFNAAFWEHPSTLWHATPDENVQSILKNGLGRRSDTRGLTNRSVGAAVFTTTEPEELATGSYGDNHIEIDCAAMKADGYTPTVTQEPEVEEYEFKRALLWKVGAEEQADRLEHGSDMSPNTVIVHGDIPPKYLKLDGAVQESRQIYGQRPRPWRWGLGIVRGDDSVRFYPCGEEEFFRIEHDHGMIPFSQGDAKWRYKTYHGGTASEHAVVAWTTYPTPEERMAVEDFLHANGMTFSEHTTYVDGYDEGTQKAALSSARYRREQARKLGIPLLSEAQVRIEAWHDEMDDAWEIADKAEHAFRASGLRPSRYKELGLVAFDDNDEPIGAVYYSVRQQPAEDFGGPEDDFVTVYEFDVGVHPKHQGGVVGWMLCKEAIRCAGNYEADLIRNWVINPKMADMLEKLFGFEHESEPLTREGYSSHMVKWLRSR